jgi:hypothetical protein
VPYGLIPNGTDPWNTVANNSCLAAMRLAAWSMHSNPITRNGCGAAEAPRKKGVCLSLRSNHKPKCSLKCVRIALNIHDAFSFCPEILCCSTFIAQNKTEFLQFISNSIEFAMAAALK